jgi:type IV pilus assembly protein PilQ
MRVKRLLTVALMALFCAGSATAASQLNAVQVTPKDNTATVSLRTTGSFAHKEYRADDHLLLIDLTGVTLDAGIQRTATVGSSVLKSYKLSSYTSASGSDVARIELVVGDGVSFDVADKSDGLQILLNGAGAPKPSTTAAPVASSAASPIQAPSKNSVSTPAYAQPVAKSSVPVPAPTTHAAPAASSARSAMPTIIRGISVQRGHGTMDVVIDGPSTVEAFVLSHPDRLVLDFTNTVVRPSVKNINVRSADVVRVRVGHYKDDPPVIRVVVDLGGPRTFDVVKSAQQVTLRISSENAATREPAVKSAPAPVVATATVPVSTPIVSAQAKPSAATPASTPSVNTSAQSKPATVTPSPVVASAPAPASSPVGATQSKPAYEVGLNAAPKAQVETPAATPKPESQPAASAPVKFQAYDAPATVMPAPAPKTSAIPQAKAVQERLASAGDTTQGQEAMATAPMMPPARPDPSMRAGQAAGTLSNATTNSQAGVLTSPAQVPGAPADAVKPKYTGEPISVNLKDVDLKDFFRLIHEISGLNIVLDPSVHGSVTLVLDDVPWDQALDIVLKNNQLDRELQGNVLRIAATDTLRKEAVDRRAQSEAVALAVDRQTVTRFLSYGKAKDIVPTVKKFLTARGDVIADERTNALIISDIPSVLPNLDRLISQLDKKSQEVEIEVRVVSATRSFSRDLGVQLGFGWGNGVTSIGGSDPNSTTGTTVTSTGTVGTSTVPLFTNFSASGATSGFSISNITKTYGIDAVLTAAESHNLAKVLSRPRIVTQSNVKAEVKQGVKLPVYTANTANSNASVNYIDSVLRLSVTPQITAEGTVFLTVDVENTQPEGSANSNGNYILSTQQATTQVLVSDGATVVIGGVIQTTNSVSTSQTPFLGNIPWLGNLFKERLVKTETDELIFFITPKIIQT